jgi:hypothetical protein
VIVDAVAIRFQVLPDVIDLSYSLTFSGAGGLLATLVGASLRFDPDRLARLVVFGNLAGAVAGMLLFALIAIGVIS